MTTFSKHERRLLKSVSRSFYLSLWIVPKAVQPPVSVGYLLCRLADTISDTSILPVEERLGTLRRFRDLFRDFPVSLNRLKEFNFENEVKNTKAKNAEVELLRHSKNIFTSFLSLSRTDQALVQNVVHAVIKGMEMDLTTFGTDAASVKALSTKEDLKKYIGWIGGEPGRFWTNVCLSHRPDLRIRDKNKWMENGFEFGKGLQMINILRDLKADLAQGRCYLPLDLLAEHGLTLESLVKAGDKEVFLTLYQRLIDETVERLRHGLAYIEQLPRSAMGLRAAVWWPLAIGLKTLEKLRLSSTILTQEKAITINRKDVYNQILSSFLFLPFNSIVKRRFQEMTGKFSIDIT